MKKRISLLTAICCLIVAVNNVDAQIEMMGGCQVSFELGNEVTLCSSVSVYPLPDGSPAGGTYSGNGVLDEFFFPSIAGPGEHIITYAYDDGFCIGTDTDTITVVTPEPIVVDGDMELCYGESTLITALNGEDIEWESGSNAMSEIHQPTETTDYTVYGFDSNGCLSATGYTILVHQLPDVQILGDTSLCIGESTTLAASGAQDYEWGGGSTDLTVQYSGTVDQSFSLTGTDEFGCVNDDMTTVTIHDYPVVMISGEDAVCPGETTVLTASGATTYIWSSGGINAEEEVTPNAATVYSVTGTSEHGCSSDAEWTISINPLPVFEVIGDNTICPGISTDLTANNPELDYEWSTGDMTPTVTFSPSATSDYTVTGTNEFNCSVTLDVEVVVFVEVIVGISGDDEICFGSSTELTAVGAGDGGQYTWTPFHEGDVYTVQPEETTTYSVEGTSVDGCTGSTTFTVNVNPVPVVEILGQENACQGSILSLSVEGDDEYVWTNGQFGNDISFMMTSDTLFAVLATNEFDCNATDNISITMIELPTVMITGDIELCFDESSILTASGAASYSWNVGSSTDEVTINYFSPGTITVIGYDDFGCSDTHSEVLIKHALSPVTMLNLSEGVLCTGDSVSLDVPEVGVATWMHDDQLLTADTVIMYVDETPFVVSAFGIDEFGCTTATVETTYFPYQAPIVNLAGDFEICLGDTAIVVATGSDNYLWSTGNDSDSLVVIPSTTTPFSISSVNEFCSTEIEFEIVVQEIPVISWAGDIEVCAGDSVTIEATGALEWLWNGEPGEMVETIDASSNPVIILSGSNGPCITVEIIELLIHELPEVVIEVSANPACVGSVVTFTANGADDFIWFNESTSPEIELVIDEITEVSVTGTDGNGCSSVAHESVDVFAVTVLTFEVDPDTVCQYDSPFELVATPEGGVFSGDGVDGNMFIPYLTGVEGAYPLTYTSVDENSCTSSITDSIYLYVCGGMNESMNAALNVFPNPCRDQFNVNANGSMIDRIVVYDGKGAIVSAMDNINSTNHAVSATEWPQGIYYIESWLADGNRYKTTIVRE